MEEYSVLMLLWYKENPEYLQASIESMAGQTAPPAEFVLVWDYEINHDMMEIVAKSVGRIPVKYVNAQDLIGQGLGSLRARGVENCAYELIACMDSDDIAFPDRCEKQLAVFQHHPDLAIVGGIIAEFCDTPEEIISYRVVPENYKEIMKYARLRDPFNHPSVMFRRSVILSIGNYQPMKGCEDYDLWFRLLKNGYKGYNIPEPILYYRTGEQFIKRRKNKTHYHCYIELKKKMWDANFINWFEYYLSIAIQKVFYYSPCFVQMFMYKFMLRKKNRTNLQVKDPESPLHLRHPPGGHQMLGKQRDKLVRRVNGDF